jgi:hypothetical protein
LDKLLAVTACDRQVEQLNHRHLHLSRAVKPSTGVGQQLKKPPIRPSIDVNEFAVALVHEGGKVATPRLRRVTLSRRRGTVQIGPSLRPIQVTWLTIAAEGRNALADT